MEAGPRGPNGDAQGVGDLRQPVPEVVMEHDDRPLLRSETAERALELVPVRNGAGEIGIGRCVGGNGADAGDPATLAACFDVAGVARGLAGPAFPA